MPTISWNLDVSTILIFILTVGFLLRDRYVMVQKHDDVIKDLAEKLTNVSDALIALTAEFHTYQTFNEKPQQYGSRSTRFD